MNRENELITRITSIVAQIEHVKCLHLSDALTLGKLSLSDGSVALQQITSLTTSIAGEVIRVMRDWRKNGGDASTLALLIKTAKIAYTRGCEDRAHVQLAWTGPIDPQVQARSTRQMLEDLIKSAQTEIIVVGYSITDGSAVIFEHLANARRRNVEVTILANQLEERLETMRRLWPQNTLAPTLFSRPASPYDPMAALHAKVILIDRKRMLITSANLTYHGLQGNIEIGIAIEDKVAENTALLIQRLIISGEVVPIKL